MQCFAVLQGPRSPALPPRQWLAHTPPIFVSWQEPTAQLGVASVNSEDVFRGEVFAWIMAFDAAARARAAVPFVDLILIVFHLFYF
jgi:hypothetical protein